MRNAQMIEALSKALDPQLARIALKKIENHKSTALEPQLQFAQLVERIHQEDNTRTQIDRPKLKTNSTPLTSSINLPLEIDNLTVDDIHTMEQDIAHGINVVQHKYSNDPNFKGKPFFLKFCKKSSRSGHSISTCPEKRYTKPLDKPNFQKQILIKQWKVIKTSLTDKSHRIIWQVIPQDTEVQTKSHKITQNPITEISISSHRVETVRHTQDQISKPIRNISLHHNNLTIIETEIVHDDWSHEIDFVMLENILIHC